MSNREEDDIFETPHGAPPPTTEKMIEDTWRRSRRQSEVLRRQDEKLERIEIGMYGRDPNRPGDGLMARVLKLEEAEAKRVKVMWAAITGAVTAVGATAWNLLSGTGK